MNIYKTPYHINVFNSEKNNIYGGSGYWIKGEDN